MASMHDLRRISCAWPRRQGDCGSPPVVVARVERSGMLLESLRMRALAAAGPKSPDRRPDGERHKGRFGIVGLSKVLLEAVFLVRHGGGSRRVVRVVSIDPQP